MLHAIFAPENSAIIGGWGLILGVIGLLIGVFGFWITLLQLSKVKTATSAAELAISSLKVRLSHFDIIQECTKAENALEALRDSILNSKGHIPLGTLDSLATSLINIQEGYDEMDAHLRSRVTEAINSVNRFSVAKPLSIDDRTARAKQATTLRDYHGLIRKVRFQVQKDQIV